MIDVVMVVVVLLVLIGLVAVIAPSFSPAVRGLVWFALFETMACAGTQMFYTRVLIEGGDTLTYSQTGVELAKFLDVNFSWAAPEMMSLLFQRPSVFDAIVYGGGGTNTGSMHAIAGWLVFIIRSPDAAQVAVAGMSMFGSLSIFRACQDAYPEGNPRRMFIAIVLFPSVAFWTATLHKESFCLVGMGILFAAWRALNARRWVGAVLYFPVGVTLILLFRAPALPPLLLGLAVFFTLHRVQKTRGVDAAVFGTGRLLVALGVVALGMVLVSRISPTLAVDKLADTISTTQNQWNKHGGDGGSTFGDGTVAEASLAGQIVRVPVALFNALFRPQLFDVHNFDTFMASIEMSTVTFLFIRAVRQHGVGGMFRKIQRSPFLLMCTIITVVGCTFVGLATLNFGSLARYRVPFLPFYGALVVILADRKQPVPTESPAIARADVRRPRRHRLSPRRTTGSAPG